MLSFTITLRNQSTKTIKTLFNMKTSKRIILLAAFVVLTFAAHAQRFEWAKTIDGYDQSSSNIANKIVGSMTDSDGNLYICAQYGWGASLCGVNLPDRGENGNMVVAKISPEGEMVWHKEIYGYRTTGGTAVGLLPMGDTAMMVCYRLIAPGYQEWIDVFGTRYGWQSNDFDSLFTGKDSLQFDHLYLLCFSTFTLDGEITATHYLTRACLDTNGNPFTGADRLHPEDSLKILVDDKFLPNALTMDGEGNIIMTRRADEWVLVYCDTCGENQTVPTQFATWNGGVGGVRYYVDGRRIYDFEVPFRAENWNVQMLKLTPNLDSVLFCQYLAYDNEGHLQNVIDLGNDDNKSRTGQCLLRDSVLYLTGALASNAYLDDITLYAGNNKSYIIKYVDTAFMTPYVYVAPPIDTTGIDTTGIDTTGIDTTGIDTTGIGIHEFSILDSQFSIYPNPFRQRVTIECIEPLAETAWLTDLTGRREQVCLQGVPADNNGPARYSLDLTSHPQAVYLLTLTTASGKTHTVRLLKQSDIFSR